MSFSHFLPLLIPLASLAVDAPQPTPALPEGWPKDSLPLETAEWPTGFRLHVEFSSANGGSVMLGKDLSIPLAGTEHDVAVEQPATGGRILRVWSDGKLVRGPEEIPRGQVSGSHFPGETLDFGADFTAFAQFSTTGGGTLFSKCSATGNWTDDAKALFIKDGKLVYNIGQLGSLTGGSHVADGKTHRVALRLSQGRAKLWLDGKAVAKADDLTRPDGKDFVFKVGEAAPNFGGDFTGGTIEVVKLWRRSLDDAEVALLFKNNAAGANTPDFTFSGAARAAKPTLKPHEGTNVKTAWVQPLERSNHREIVAAWNEKSLAEGREIYNTLCVVCHGTKEAPGSLPTALRFTEGAFKNGADPHSIWLTLTKGYGQMVAQPQYTTEQKYSVIHYIRETFLKPHNPSQYTEISPDYLKKLPLPLAKAEAEIKDETPPPYQQMELGPALFWTFEVAPGNIAQKGLAVRLDAGPGGVTKGRAWMIYDHDTLRVATAITGSFVDWRGIAFDGSHGTHTSLTGEHHFINPPSPGVPREKNWEDPRPLGRDGKPYGPLPAEQGRYRGLYVHGDKVVLSYTVGGVPVVESPGWLDYGATPIFYRTFSTLDIGQPDIRIAPVTVSASVIGSGKLRQEAGFWVVTLEPKSECRVFTSRADQATLESLAKSVTEPMDLRRLMKKAPDPWPDKLTTKLELGAHEGAFAADTIHLPEANPWHAWLRPGGFDFLPDGKSAVVAFWNGDVFKVSGLTSSQAGNLEWKRLAAGLFQPLGVKIHEGLINIACRDQIARLHDYENDGVIDCIRCFNGDHQVTEHFHEFAMGLQTDAEGNFYYAKSARHALKAVVPHHGTLLKVSADGSKTEILATGFRAANGVCLNPDGSFFVTDQEGHWMPKNRINRVVRGGFYGNIFGYTDVTDPADSAMEPPLVWITNQKDRSPAELLWVPKDTWGNLGGSLLNLSYGTGKIFIVPHEVVEGVWQGAVCELPLPAFETGVMRGRFGPDGQLYACGMFAWAGNATAPGGFHRIRRTDQPAGVPTAVKSGPDTLTITFSDALDPASVTPQAFSFQMWQLKRTERYGSEHYDEKNLPVSEAVLASDQKTVKVTIPGLSPTHCYELKAHLAFPNGEKFERSLHGTLHHIGK